MRHVALFLTLVITGVLFAQKDGYEAILRLNPVAANGYFIVNPEQWDQLDIDHINVDIVLVTPQADESSTKEVVQQFTIHEKEDLYGKADLAILSTLDEGQYVSYRLQAVDKGGLIQVDVDPQYTGDPGPVWGQGCNEGCLGNTYAWLLWAEYCPELSESNIMMTRGTTPNGELFYFYIPQSRWAQFKSQYPFPSNFNIESYGDWNAGLNSTNSHKIIYGPATSEMRDEQGFTLTPGENAYGIPKLCGPWEFALEGARTGNLNMSISQLCQDTGGYYNTPGNLRPIFNNDPVILGLMAQYGAPPLECHPLFPLGGAGLQWGGVFTECTAVTVYSNENPDGTVDILGWMMELTNCAVSPAGYEPYIDLCLTIEEVTPGGTEPVMGVSLPFGKDPKLVVIPKTELEPGLYQFMVIGKDGQVIRHIEDFESPVVLNSRFASLADINIYPVPVSGMEFAVEFNLATPLQIDITVVDNTGEQFLTKEVDFPTAGLDKIVIGIDNQWKPGLYHAIFQFQDGSSTSKNFTIGE
ncbi:MAG: hypothetical protein K8H89_14510 [Flavobacteriales bacterium]|nr:hypothetical protein [Flavobacteriales bacterium]